jgi:hypothetical protein
MHSPGPAHAPRIPATRQGEPNLPQVIAPIGLDDLLDPTPHKGQNLDSQRFQEMLQGHGNRPADQQSDPFFLEPQGLPRSIRSPQFHLGSSAAALENILDDQDVLGRVKDGRDGILPDGQGNLHSGSPDLDSSCATNPLENLLQGEYQDPCHRTGHHQNTAIIDTKPGSEAKAGNQEVAELQPRWADEVHDCN